MRKQRFARLPENPPVDPVDPEMLALVEMLLATAKSPEPLFRAAAQVCRATADRLRTQGVESDAELQDEWASAAEDAADVVRVAGLVAPGRADLKDALLGRFQEQQEQGEEPEQGGKGDE